MASASPAPPTKSQSPHNSPLPRHSQWNKDANQRRSKVKSPLPPRDFSHQASPAPVTIRQCSTIAGDPLPPQIIRRGLASDPQGIHSKLDSTLNPEKHSQKIQTKSKDEDVEPPPIKKSKILVKIPCSRRREEEIPIPNKPKCDERIEEETKVWNLRPRNSIRRPMAAEDRTNASEKTKAKPKSGENCKKTKKEKLSIAISLSKEEIEEDIFSLVGSKPSRRPKKRPRNVQSQLDNLFPGLWLGSISAESYRVSQKSMKD